MIIIRTASDFLNVIQSFIKLHQLQGIIYYSLIISDKICNKIAKLIHPNYHSKQHSMITLEIYKILGKIISYFKIYIFTLIPNF